jgi:menaquinol-cytochrome c reductase iron-sulfur subunit
MQQIPTPEIPGPTLVEYPVRRRKFFRRMIGFCAGVIGAGLAIPLLGYVISPAFKRREQPWVEVGKLDELPVGEPTQLDHLQTVQDGWRATTSHKAVWAIKQTDGRLTVFSPLCPHIGCGYRWDGQDRKFHCPCHGSVYSMNGQVLGGPAPRPLDELPNKVEEGRVLVMYKEFKAGLAQRVEV